MPVPFSKLPIVFRCCGCVTELKTAVAIIIVFGIVTSPVVSWAVVRHSYVIHVSYVITTSAIRPDIVDINLYNVLSFGFGANAGSGHSCLQPIDNSTAVPTDKRILEGHETNINSKFIKTIVCVGWMVLIFDIIFLLVSCVILIKLFRSLRSRELLIYIYTIILSVIPSFVYGLLYVVTCIYVGGAFPIFEFIFSCVDLGLWLYFIVVVNSYQRQYFNNEAIP